MERFKLVMLFIIACLCSSCSKSVYYSVWQSKAVKADGNLREWKIPLKYFDDKSRLQYTIANDSVNLYLCIRATEQQSQSKIFHAGMQIWIDTTGKTKKQTGLFFPLANNEIKRPSFYADSLNSGARQFQKPGSKTLKSRYDENVRKMQLVGFKKPIAGIVPLNNEYHITAGIDFDSLGCLNYEAIIPFKTFYKEALSLCDSAKVFGINIMIPVPPEQAMSGRGGGKEEETQEAGGIEPGEGSFRGGGMHRPGGEYGGAGQREGSGSENYGEGSGGSMSMLDAITIKVRIKLAAKH